MRGFQLLKEVLWDSTEGCRGEEKHLLPLISSRNGNCFCVLSFKLGLCHFLFPDGIEEFLTSISPGCEQKLVNSSPTWRNLKLSTRLAGFAEVSLTPYVRDNVDRDCASVNGLIGFGMGTLKY